ncbi:glycosyltransferase family 2 protein [soil metagenome]
MDRAPITAVLITLNEEHNLEFCLRSLRPWCDEIIVVDMLSEDRTPQIAARYADLVLPHERIEAFDQARGAGIQRARNEWIVVLDADELIPPRLGEWIADWVRQEPAHDVALLPRVNVFLGRWIRSSNWWPGLPRLFRRDSMHISEQLHRGLQPVPGARVKRLPKDPQLSIWHFSYASLDALTSKTNRYTTIEARQAIARGRPSPKPWRLFPRALRGMWFDYVMRRGYRDGLAGLTYAINRAYYRYLSMAKRWDEREAPGRQARYDRMREKILSGYSGNAGSADLASAEGAATDGSGGG